MPLFGLFFDYRVKLEWMCSFNWRDVASLTWCDYIYSDSSVIVTSVTSPPQHGVTLAWYIVLSRTVEERKPSQCWLDLTDLFGRRIWIWNGCFRSNLFTNLRYECMLAIYCLLHLNSNLRGIRLIRVDCKNGNVIVKNMYLQKGCDLRRYY